MEDCPLTLGTSILGMRNKQPSRRLLGPNYSKHRKGQSDDQSLISQAATAYDCCVASLMQSSGVLFRFAPALGARNCLTSYRTDTCVNQLQNSYAPRTAPQGIAQVILGNLGCGNVNPVGDITFAKHCISRTDIAASTFFISLKRHLTHHICLFYRHAVSPRRVRMLDPTSHQSLSSVAAGREQYIHCAFLMPPVIRRSAQAHRPADISPPIAELKTDMIYSCDAKFELYKVTVSHQGSRAAPYSGMRSLKSLIRLRRLQGIVA